MTRDLMTAVQALGRARWMATLAIAAAVIAFPLLARPYYTSFGLSIAMYITLAASWNLISGYAGYVSFGHVVFWGTGAYGAAVLATRTEFPLPVVLLGGGILALVLALVVARPILKLSGVYFAISTLAVAEAAGVFAGYFSLTGAGGGLNLPPSLSLDTAYVLMWLVAFASTATTYTLAFTVFGRSLMAIRDNESAAGSLGIDTTWRKVQVFALSAFLAGLAGSIYVLNVAFIDPRTGFDIQITLRSIMMAMFGGIGTVLGPVVGALAFQIPSELLWVRFPFLHKAILGGLIILVVLVLPNGILPSVTSWRRHPWSPRAHVPPPDAGDVQ